jgi:hypothetical protein
MRGVRGFLFYMDYFKLTRSFWDFAFENPEKIKPNHCALYLFIVEHCNRLGWKRKFGLPTTMAKDAIGIRSYNTYITTLNDLVGFGMIELIEKSKNQYSSNIVAISNFDKALDKALDKATIKHVTKQSESTVQSIDSIDKHITNIPITNKHEIFKNECLQSQQWLDTISMNIKIPLDKIGIALKDFNNHLIMTGNNYTTLKEYKNHFTSWSRKVKQLNKS